MNGSDLNNESLRALAQQSLANICWIFFSSIAIITNCFVLITIFSTKSLHNRSQFLIVSHTFAEILYMCAYFGTGLVRYLEFLLSQPEKSNQLICILKQAPLEFSGAIAKLFSLGLACDRFIGLAFPIFYKTSDTKNYVLVVNVVIWCYCIGRLPFAFAFYDRKKIFPVCTFATSFDERYKNYVNVESSVAIYSTVIIYGIAAAIMLRRYKRKTFSGEDEKTEWRREMEFQVFISLSMIGVLYCVSKVAGIIVSTICNRIGTLQANLLLAPIVSLMGIFNATSHFFIYLKLNVCFRKSFFKLIFRRKNNTIAPSEGS